MITVLFLDLNGTIINDWDASYAGMCACCKHYNVPAPTLEAYILGVAQTGDYLKFYENLGIYADRDTLYTLFLPVYRAKIGNFDALRARVFPGVYETLLELAKRNVEIHILTAARDDLVESIVHAINIRDYCHYLHYHVHDKATRVREIIENVYQPRHCALMGDLPSDVTHAQRAGIQGIGFANPDVPRVLFTNAGLSHMVLSFPGILDLC